MGPIKAIAPRSQCYRIVRDQQERIRAFRPLPGTDVLAAPEETIIIVNGRASARSVGIVNCAGVALVNERRPEFGIIHTNFPADLDPTMRFVRDLLRCRPAELVIGLTGMKGYTAGTLAESLAVAGSFGRVVYTRLGVSADISVDYRARRGKNAPAFYLAGGT